MQLDVPTLIIAACLLSALFAVAFVAMGAGARSYPGYASWALSSALIGLGLAFMVLRGAGAPVALSVVSTNLVLVLAFLARYDGVRRFAHGRGIPSWLWGALPLLDLAAVLPLTLPVDLLLPRSAVTSGVVAALLLLTAHASWRAQIPVGWTLKLLGLLQVLVALSLLTRMLVWFGSPQEAILSSPSFQVAFWVVVLLAQCASEVAFMLSHTRRARADLEASRADLARALEETRAAQAEARTLSGLLPICAHCKKIRDDAGYWREVETYVEERSGAEFSHSICPSCVETYFPDEPEAVR